MPVQPQRMEHGERQTLVKVVHAIYPRNAAEKPMARRGPMDSMSMPFASVYYEAGASMDEGFLREGGYRRMPVLAFQWRRKGSSPYGDSPCMAALPFDRQLQAMTLTKGEVAALAAKPPVQAPIALKNQRLDLDAGGVTYYDQTTQYAGVRPLIERAPDINPLREDVLDIRDQIRSALYVDLFLALNRIDQRMTAGIMARYSPRPLGEGPGVRDVWLRSHSARRRLHGCGSVSSPPV